MLGHELRNPLSAISNAAQVARLQPGGDAADRAQGVVARQVAHLTRLVDDLLDAGWVASGKIVLERVPLELADVVRRGAAAIGDRAHQHTLTLDLQPVWVDGDETRLEQVVSNLLTNALRYTPPGGAVAVRLVGAGKEALLTVSDTGIGIPPELLPRLFDLFVQGSRGIERSQGGLGIGLTIVRRLVELHGGKVEAASEGSGRGSRFTVRLPRVDMPVQAAAGAAGDGTAAAADSPRRVLVVEDNEDARTMLAMTLELSGHEVIERPDGPSGIEAALTLHPDVALIDIGLPGTDGYEVARRIRAGTGGSRMLLIALTGYGQPEDRDRSLAAGFDLHCTKPLDSAQLMQVIAGWPSDRDTEAAPAS